jgi:S-adenosylmethionine uptake transporter
VNRVAQHSIKAFSAALGAVAVLSIMDAVMKHLVLVIGIFAVSVWRSLANLVVSAMLYLACRAARHGRAATPCACTSAAESS